MEAAPSHVSARGGRTPGGPGGWTMREGVGEDEADAGRRRDLTEARVHDTDGSVDETRRDLQGRDDVTGDRMPSLAPPAVLHRLRHPRSHAGRPPHEDPLPGGAPSFAGSRSPPPGLPTVVPRTTSFPRARAVARRYAYGRSVAGRPHHTFLLHCPKIRPSAGEHLHGVHSRRPRRDLLRERPATAAPRSALGVSHPLDGFLLRGPACVLQHAPSPGVRPVLPPRGDASRRPLHPSKLSLRP